MLPSVVWGCSLFEDISKKTQQISLGPEIYHIKRIRKGGTRQHGMMVGVRASYDRIGRYKWYVGFESAWAQGILKGGNKLRESLKSRFTDGMVEGRFGYTLQAKTGLCASLTPFIGAGYFVEKNHYIHPSKVHLCFCNTFWYLAFGGYSRIYINPYFSAGLNVTGKYSLDGKVRVTRDPEFEDTTLHYEHKMQCRVAIPFALDFFCSNYQIGFTVSPFYEFRHFGGQNQVPFNFNDTRLKVHGVDFFFVCKF